MYIPLYLPGFSQNIEEYSNLKKFVERKINSILVVPYSSETLKYALSGLRSCPVRGRYLVIFGILEEHKKNDYQFNFSFESAKELDEKTVIFVAFGPHDDAYKIANKITEIEVPFKS